MAKYLTGNETVRHERLLDTIKVRSAFQTPLLSRLPHETTDHIITEWPIDQPFAPSDSVRSITAPHGDSKTEGSDFTDETPSYETRLKTICEIKHSSISMSGSDRSARIAGMEDPFDYRMGKMLTRHFNSIDNTGMYGTGATETDGSSFARRTQGLIYNSAVTGIERNHGTVTDNIEDPYGVTIPASYWSVFQDFEHSNITMESFYNNLIAPALTAGADLENPWEFDCGYRVMQRISRFLIADGGILLNERQRNADDTMGSDYMNTFRLASGHVVSFRTNRWLNETDDTFTVQNNDPTPTAGASPGSQSRTLYGDQTIIGHEPGCVRWLWYREPAFRTIETAADESRVAVVSEFGLMVDHPLCVMGAGNVLS